MRDAARHAGRSRWRVLMDTFDSLKKAGWLAVALGAVTGLLVSRARRDDHVRSQADLMETYHRSVGRPDAEPS